MFTTGVTVPTLHVGMLYTASCWSTDIHHLPYVQYLHGEADIVWWDIQDIHVVSKAVSYLSDDMNMINVDMNVLLQVFCAISRRGQVQICDEGTHSNPSQQFTTVAQRGHSHG